MTPRTCVENKVCQHGVAVDANQLPGQLYNLHEQCQMMLGNLSHAVGTNRDDSIPAITHLHENILGGHVTHVSCYEDHNNIYIYIIIIIIICIIIIVIR